MIQGAPDHLLTFRLRISFGDSLSLQAVSAATKVHSTCKDSTTIKTHSGLCVSLWVSSYLDYIT